MGIPAPAALSRAVDRGAPVKFLTDMLQGAVIVAIWLGMWLFLGWAWENDPSRKKTVTIRDHAELAYTREWRIVAFVSNGERQ